MDLETSIVERLQKLRFWQIEQQERLLQQQLAQREILSHEQDKMYQALGLSIQDFNNSQTIIGELNTSSSNTEVIGTTGFQVTAGLDRSIDFISNETLSHSAERINPQGDSNSKAQSRNKLNMPCVELTTANTRYSLCESNNGEHIYINPHSINLHSSLRNEDAPIQTFLMEGVAPLSAGTPKKKNIIIDDVPVPSPKKDFQTLLEEKLKNYTTESNTEMNSESKATVKRPFLKKGQGLARFKMNQGPNKASQRMRQRSASLSANLSSSKQTKTLANIINPKSMPTSAAQIGAKGAIVGSVKEQQLSLRNVPPPQKKIRTKSESALSTKQINATGNEVKRSADLTGSDTDSRTHNELEEVRIFELLEEKAENSSFCSTSSTVVAFLQQSTPFRIRKNVLKSRDSSVYSGEQSNASRDNNEYVIDNTRQSFSQGNLHINRPSVQQERTKQTIFHKSLKKTVDPYWAKTNLLYEEDDDEVSITNVDNCSVNAKNIHSTQTDDLQQLSVKVDLNKLPSRNTYVSHIQEKHGLYDRAESDNDIDVNSSLHVRFSEYNEYKTIGLTDTSSISNESLLIKNYTDEGAWTDCSQSSESSNMESFIAKCRATKFEGSKHKQEPLKHQPTITHNNGDDIHSEMQEHGLTEHMYKNNEEQFESSDVTDHSSDEEKSSINEVCSEEEQFLDMSDNAVITLFEKGTVRKACASTNTDIELSMEHKQAPSGDLKDSSATIFKSELLKSRLIELEKEIDIFRKENSALSIQRQKLQEDYVKLHKEFKKKETDFEDTRRRVEERLNEEKKKLIREKTALESRIRDSQEKAQQNKLERQEIQNLKQQLIQLTQDMNNKESRWNAAQSRHRSQVRILRSENAKLKEELETLQKSKKNTVNARKPGHISNSKAIHQITKQVNDHAKDLNKTKKDSVSEDEEKLVEQMMDAVYPESNNKKLSYGTSNDYIENNEDKVDDTFQKPRKAHKSLESVARKRSLYEQLLKDATSSFNVTGDTSKHSDAQEFTHCAKNKMKVETENKYNKNSQFDIIPPIIKPTGENYDGNNFVENEHSKLTCVSFEEPPNSSDKHNTLPDISHTRTSPSSKNISTDKQDVKRIQHLDGRVEYWYANGNIKKVFPDQGVSKMIYYNGDVQETDRNGKVKYFYASTRTWHTTMPDGLEILEFPDGQIERRSLSGTVEICFPDGSIRTLKSDGTEKWALPDETIVETFPNGEKILTLPNGQREVHTMAHKRREYPDGTVKLVYPDGTQVTRYSNGRTRLKDKDGNLLMDSY